MSSIFSMRNGKLLEDVRLGSLVLADPQTVVTAIADPPLVSLLATDDRERALELFEKYDRVALPVTDALGNMLGIVTADDMSISRIGSHRRHPETGRPRKPSKPLHASGTLVHDSQGAAVVIGALLGEMLTATR